MKSRVVSVGIALVATALWVLASPLVSQSDETPLGPSLERFESHLERWDVGSDREVQMDLKDGTTNRNSPAKRKPVRPASGERV